jgi:hypothetical protein
MQNIEMVIYIRLKYLTLRVVKLIFKITCRFLDINFKKFKDKQKESKHKFYSFKDLSAFPV